MDSTQKGKMSACGTYLLPYYRIIIDSRKLCSSSREMAISSYSFPISKVKVVDPSGGCLRCSSSPSQSCRDQGSLMALFRGKVIKIRKTIVEEIDPTSLAVELVSEAGRE